MTTDHRPILFVTASSPMSRDEPFVQDEVTRIASFGCPVIVAPVRRLQATPNDAAVASGLAASVRSEALLSGSIVAGALATTARHPLRTIRSLVQVLRGSGSRRNLQNNLLSFPKALWVARLAERHSVRHIHSYWLGHSTTVAMVAASITRVPWSATGYRWDIDAANCFVAKFRTARFLRCADEMGYAQLVAHRDRLGASTPIHLVRTGVPMPDRAVWDQRPIDTATICCAGTFVEKKGQRFLLEAAARLRGDDIATRIELYGEGPFEQDLRDLADRLGISADVTFHGMVPLAELREALQRRPILVLPSIITPDGQQEGIPVVLIEAMANGAPVISTTTGSIADLVTPDCGRLVPPADVDALAQALAETIADVDGAAQRALTAHARVVEEFSLAATSARVLGLIDGALT